MNFDRNELMSHEDELPRNLTGHHDVLGKTDADVMIGRLGWPLTPLTARKYIVFLDIADWPPLSASMALNWDCISAPVQAQFSPYINHANFILTNPGYIGVTER